MRGRRCKIGRFKNLRPYRHEQLLSRQFLKQPLSGAIISTSARPTSAIWPSSQFSNTKRDFVSLSRRDFGLENVMEHNAQVFLALSISGALCFIAWRWARYRAARLREVTKHASSRDAEQK